MNGCIGYSGGFAVFPTVEQGEIALRDLLKNGYKNSSLQSMMKGFANPEENDTVKYVKFILSKTGIKNPKTMMRNLTQKQFEALVKAIKQYEGWEVGHINLPLRITKVLKDRKKKNIIVAYYVEKMGWVEKDRAIALSESYKVDGVVATSRAGNLYIRTRHDVKVTNNLGVLG